MSRIQRGYFPLYVLFRTWDEKGDCLRKWWNRCYMRCILKSYLYWHLSNKCPSSFASTIEYLHEIISLCKKRRCLIFHLYFVISNLGWYWKGQNFPTETVSSFMILFKIITDFMLLYLSNQLFIFTWFFLTRNLCPLVINQRVVISLRTL